MGSYNSRFNWIVVAQLNLDALAKRWKHFGEDQLFVPNRSVTVLFHCCFALEWLKTLLYESLMVIYDSLLIPRKTPERMGQPNR